MSNVPEKQNLSVIVIGAGTGGLCLAHGLKRAGITVNVFERDRTRKDGLQGFRVGIDPDGCRALDANLPPALYETFLATCAISPQWFNMLSEHYRELLSLKPSPPRDPRHGERSVSRMTLRQVLLTGLEDVTHFDKVASILGSATTKCLMLRFRVPLRLIWAAGGNTDASGFKLKN